MDEQPAHDVHADAGRTASGAVSDRRAMAEADGTRDRGRVAIIGAGFSGLAAAVALRRKGIEDFVIFERAESLGGTWWANRYPGAEVDLESHIYSFSFERHDWSRNYATWRELLSYLEGVAEKWDLLGRMRFGERVEEVAWSDARHAYRITTSSGRDHGEFSAVISAVGFLSKPVLPSFARGETPFRGVQCHTSEWPEGLDLSGKRVGVLGTGSSAVQVIAEAAKVAREVKVFQRRPNWILPKDARDFTPLERALHRIAPIYWWKRLKLYLGYDVRQIGTAYARKDARVNRKRAARARAFLEQSLGDRPDLLKLATPAYEFEARRTVLSDDYYETLKRSNVELVPNGAADLTADGLVDEAGVEHPLDVIVYATGFEASNYLAGITVKGENGADLHDVWAGEPEALLGLMVPGFPNFFMMYGPNTNGLPLVTFYEAQAAFCASLIKKMRRAGKHRIEVDPHAARRFNEKLQAQLARTVWATTESYFKSGTGKVVSQWPFSASAYLLQTKLARLRSVRLR